MPLPTFRAECTHTEIIANDIYEIHFTKPEGFSFKAGQFIMINTPLADDPDDIQARAYSIASTPGEKELKFVVKYREGGRFGEFMKQKLEVGTEVEIQGPLGVFTLEPGEKDVLFICTSTGNAPFRSIILDAIDRGDTRKMDLVYGVRHKEDLFWQGGFKAIAEKYPSVSVHISLTKPDDSWEGLSGRVQTVVPGSVENLSDRLVYVCGNPAMTDEIKKHCLEEWGIPKEALHVEGYV